MLPLLSGSGRSWTNLAIAGFGLAPVILKTVIRQSLPMAFAQYLAIYVAKSQCRTMPREELQSLYEHSFQNWDLKRQLEIAMIKVRSAEPEINRLEQDRAELMRQRDVMRSERDRFKRHNEELLLTIERLRREAQGDRAGGQVIFINTLIVGGTA